MLVIPLRVEFVPRRTAWLCHAVAAVVLWRMAGAIAFPQLEDVPLRAVAQAIGGGDAGRLAIAIGADLLNSRPGVVHLLFAVMMFAFGPALENRLTVFGLFGALVATTLVTPAVAATGLLELPGDFDLLTGTALGMAGVCAWVLRNEEVTVFYLVPYASIPGFRVGSTTTHVMVFVAVLLVTAWVSMIWGRPQEPGPYPNGYVGGPFWTFVYPVLAALVAFALESVMGGGGTEDEDSTSSRSRRSASAARP